MYYSKLNEQHEKRKQEPGYKEEEYKEHKVLFKYDDLERKVMEIKTERAT